MDIPPYIDVCEPLCISSDWEARRASDPIKLKSEMIEIHMSVRNPMWDLERAASGLNC